MKAESARTEELELRLLLEAVHSRYGHDFRGYSPASLLRRLTKAREHFDCGSLSQLQHRLLHEPEFFPRLLPFLTVQVSDMFRDPDYYLALRRKVVPHLRTYPSLKVWVAGCACGEELYSLAILFREEGLSERTIFYATDINRQALEQARGGVYDLDRIQQFTENHRRAGGTAPLHDYYTASYGRAVFDRSLRENTVFSDHSLATDAVFAEVHLVSCRNVLIYFNRELQDRALGLFSESLVRRGFLGLGLKETLRFSSQAEAFEAFSPEERIYQKRAGA